MSVWSGTTCERQDRAATAPDLLAPCPHAHTKDSSGDARAGQHVNGGRPDLFWSGRLPPCIAGAPGILAAMRSHIGVSLGIAAVLLLAGCASSVPAEAPASSSAASQAPTRTEVPWGDYDPSVQTRIDDLTDAADCSALQAEFDTADANNDITMNRTGHNNADLMTYIDEALELAGCY